MSVSSVVIVCDWPGCQEAVGVPDYDLLKKLCWRHVEPLEADNDFDCLMDAYHLCPAHAKSSDKQLREEYARLRRRKLYDELKAEFDPPPD